MATVLTCPRGYAAAERLIGTVRTRMQAVFDPTEMSRLRRSGGPVSEGTLDDRLAILVTTHKQLHDLLQAAFEDCSRRELEQGEDDD